MISEDSIHDISPPKYDDVLKEIREEESNAEALNENETQGEQSHSCDVASQEIPTAVNTTQPVDCDAQHDESHETRIDGRFATTEL